MTAAARHTNHNAARTTRDHSPGRMRLLIVDDHPPFVRVCGTCSPTEPDFDVVAAVATADGLWRSPSASRSTWPSSTTNWAGETGCG